MDLLFRVILFSVVLFLSLAMLWGFVSEWTSISVGNLCTEFLKHVGNIYVETFCPQAIYRKDVGAELYIDNTLKAQDNVAETKTITTHRTGHVVLGRYVDDSVVHGKLTVDWLTIWDRPLTVEERNLVHQS